MNIKERDITDKVVMLTGGAKGIGFAIADHFLKKKARVVIILDVDKEKGEEAVQKLEEKYGKHKAVFQTCDTTKDLERWPKKFMHIYNYFDVLINNVGILDESDRVKMVETNLIWTIQWSLKVWRCSRIDTGTSGCTIINIASMHGLKLDPFLPTYQAASFGIIGFTKSLGHSYHYNKTGIRVMALCPGFTHTNMMLCPKTMPYYKIKDEPFENDFEEYLNKQQWQEADVVGEATVKMFEEGESGCVWTVEGGDLTKNVF